MKSGMTTGSAASDSGTMKKNIGRVAFCGALMLGGIGVFFSTFDTVYQTGFAASDSNAMVLPRILLIILVGLTAITCFTETSRPRDASHKSVGLKTSWVAGLFVLATAIMPYTGFVLCIAPLIAMVTYALGETRWHVIAGIAGVVGIGFWYLFHHILLIRLPSIASGGAF